MAKQVYINNEVARILGQSLNKQGDFQSFSGTDIQAVIYLPDVTASTLNPSNKKFKIFANLQTMSISSTRSISPARVLGRASPVGYCRGARTIAGTMVFASINEDVFRDLYDESIAESTINASSSLLSDQLPPFSIVITASNEKGGAAIHVVHGITIVNYGTTYSIDDLYTETTYSYVATDVLPLMTLTPSQARDMKDKAIPSTALPNNISTKIIDTLGTDYGSTNQYYERAKKMLSRASKYQSDISDKGLIRD